MADGRDLAKSDQPRRRRRLAALRAHRICRSTSGSLTIAPAASLTAYLTYAVILCLRAFVPSCASWWLI